MCETSISEGRMDACEPWQEMWKLPDMRGTVRCPFSRQPSRPAVRLSSGRFAVTTSSACESSDWRKVTMASTVRSPW